jgi:ribosomal protein S18 acetylase RimI-like enzyme
MATTELPQVSIIFPHQSIETAAMLGRAFVDDPLVKAILPQGLDPGERARRAGGIFDVILRGHRHEGQPVVGVMHQGSVAGAAVIEQVVRPPSLIMAIVAGLPTLPALVRAAGLGGVMRALSVLDTLTRNRPPEPHLYLNILGVEPALQRRHFGVAILDYLRAQVDLRSDLLGVYLETATEANVSYYSHVGYRVIGEIYPLGVRMWRMLQPRTP